MNPTDERMQLEDQYAGNRSDFQLQNLVTCDLIINLTSTPEPYEQVIESIFSQQ